MKIKLDGKEYEFALQNGALCDFQEATGKNPYKIITGLNSMDSISPLELTQLIYYGCQDAHNKFPFTFDQVKKSVRFDEHFPVVAEEALRAIIGDEKIEELKAKEDSEKKN